jgi:hypothetical protein
MSIRVQIVACIVAFFLLGGYLMWSHGVISKAVSPTVAWTVGDGKAARQYDELAPETPVHLTVEWKQPMYWYVASWSTTDGTLALFPSPWLMTDATNPLHGRVELPGHREGKTLTWPVRGGVPGVTVYMVVAAAKPVAELDALFLRMRQASNTTFPDKQMVITGPKDKPLAEVPPAAKIPHPLLQAAADIDAVDPDGPMQAAAGHPGVFLASWKLAGTQKK